MRLAQIEKMTTNDKKKEALDVSVEFDYNPSVFGRDGNIRM